MHIRTISAAAVVIISLSAAGCATPMNNEQIGTGVGAVAGGVIGNALFDNTLGTVGGAAAGALIGNKVGENRDRSHYDYRN